MLGGILCAAFLVQDAGAVTPDNPFQSIVDRNVFGLKPPPPPPAPPEPPKPPLPPIALTGIMTGIGKKRALLEGVMPAKPPDQPKKSFYTLGEGEQQDEIKVLKIDEKANTVELTLMGVQTNLTFAAKAPPSAPAPGQPPPGIPSPVHTGVNPAIPQPVNYNRTLPARPTRTGPEAGTPQAYSPTGGQSTQSADVGHYNPAVQGLSQDEYALVLEAERERTKNDVMNGQMAPMPVTHLTPKGAVGTVDDDESTLSLPSTTTTSSRYGRRTTLPQ